MRSMARQALQFCAWHLLFLLERKSLFMTLELPHATVNNQGTQQFNGVYFLVAVIAMLFSAFEIWYNELPEVRRALQSA